MEHLNVEERAFYVVHARLIANSRRGQLREARRLLAEARDFARPQGLMFFERAVREVEQELDRDQGAAMLS